MDTKINSIFDLIPAKSAFWLGFATAILCLGTVGFIVLGSCVLKGNCSVNNFVLNTNSAKAAQDNTNNNATQPTAVPAISLDDHVQGDPNAPIAIIEYSDFECPYCASFHPTMEKIMENYKGKVMWVFRNFPLSFHEQAIPAASAAECASEQGQFWNYADKLYTNQTELGDVLYKRLANELKLNIGQWETCYYGKKYDDAIKQQANTGASAGVSGTPASFIIDKDGNATPIKGALPYESITAALDEMLK